MSEPGEEPAADLLRVVRPTPPGNLPRWLTSFVGRASELSELGRILRAARLVTMTGIGGIGKTRLAVELASRTAARFPDGTWFVDMAGLHEPAQVGDRLALVLDLRLPAGESTLAALLGHLHARRALILIDCCEHLVGACAELAHALARDCPDVTVLATSRVALGVPGELVRPVPPLDAGQPGGVRDAVRLFLDRAGDVRPLLPASEAAVATICQRLEGIPLAIELAAAMTPVLSLAQIEARLGGQLALLAGGSRVGPRRHRTLRATLDWSHDLLDPQERVLLRRAGVFAGGFTLRSVEEICAGGDVEADTVVHVIRGLVAKSLVVADTAGAEAHYRLLQPVREYAGEQLAVAGELDELRDRLSRRCARWVVEEAEPGMTGADQAAWLDRLDGEHDNLREAIRWCLTAGRHERCLRLTGGLWRYWYLRGHINEGRQHLQAALAAAAPTATPERAKALRGAGVLARVHGDLGRARAHHEEALDLLRGLGDRRGVAATLNSLGGIAHMEGRMDHAATLYGGECLETYRELGDDRGVATCLNNLSAVARAQGDPGRAVELGARSASVYHRIDFAEGEAAALLNVSIASARLGQLDQARAGLRLSLALFRRLGYREGMAECIEHAAHLGILERRDPAAVKLLGAAEALRELLAAPVAVPADAIDLREDVERLRGRMRRSSFAAGWAQGRTMAVDEAAELAMRIGHEPERPAAFGGLSPRELEVARLIAEGLRDRDVAERLFLSVRTIEKHVEHIRDKLGLQSRAELGAWAAAAGLARRPEA
jgi:predicted ATPase/DNA-binding CsgD family transcriptional regulator